MEPILPLRRTALTTVATLFTFIGLCFTSTAIDELHDIADDNTTVTPTSVVPLVKVTGTSEPMATPEATFTAAANPIPGRSYPEPYYGMHFVPSDDLAQVKGLGVEVVLAAFPHDGGPDDWLAYLDAAQAQDIRVIAWLWPEGWSWDGSTWQIDRPATLFLQTVAGHPALFAVYALHEPYWNGCWGCGYTTAEQQALYNAIKAIANVPIHSAVDSMSAWTKHGEETAFADGICDYCETWYHPFRANGTYERERMISQLEADLKTAREQAPNSKVVWSMQTFAQQETFRMPTAEEMQDMASIVYSRDVAGALWYPWRFGELYSDFLVNHQELYPVVADIHRELVLSRRE